MDELPPTTSKTKAPFPNSDPTVGEFREKYRRADEFAREVAFFRDDVAIPANNELRYAGYHLLCAIGDGGELNDIDQLRRAISHCQRAVYEAADAGILSTLDMIEIFQDDYRQVVISEKVPNYLDIKKDAARAQKLLETTRNHGVDGATVSDEYLKTFQTMKSHCESLEAAREELNKEIRKDIRDSQRFYVVITLTLLGIILSIIFFTENYKEKSLEDKNKTHLSTEEIIKQNK